MRCSQDSRLERQVAAQISYAHEPSGVDRLDQFALERGRQFTDLVEKKRAVTGMLQPTGVQFASVGAGAEDLAK